MLIKAIIWFFFFYVVFKVFRFYKKIMKSSLKNDTDIKSEVHESTKIDKADIIDAEFEDLPPSENVKENSSENS